MESLSISADACQIGNVKHKENYDEKRERGTKFYEPRWGQLHTQPHVRPTSCHVASLSWQKPEEEVNKLLLRKVSGIRNGITDMYPDIVKQVDPKGHIMDVLIQHHVLSEQIAEELCRKETRQARCESMLQKLLLSEHPHAFSVLRTALQKDYSFILEKIGEATTGTLMTVLTCRILV